MLRNVATSLIALSITVLAVEAALAIAGAFEPSPRLFPGDRPVGTYENTDTLIGWKLPANARIPARPAHGDYSVVYVADESGFRAGVPSSDGADAPAGPRIAFLGDSFTFGVGVQAEETFAHRVPELLGRGRAANYGMSGFGIDQMWLTLRHYVSKDPPDIVVLSFIVDDLNRSMSAYRLRDTLERKRSEGLVGWVEKPAFDLGNDGRLHRLAREDRPRGATRWLAERSRILELLRRLENRVSRTLPVGHRWRLNREFFRAIAAECERLGARLLVVYIPARGETEIETPVFSHEFAKLGIPFLDLQQALPTTVDDLYFAHDRHFNAEGHLFAARTIARTLRSLGWVRTEGGVEP